MNFQPTAGGSGDLEAPAEESSFEVALVPFQTRPRRELENLEDGIVLPLSMSTQYSHQTFNYHDSGINHLADLQFCKWFKDTIAEATDLKQEEENLNRENINLQERITFLETEIVQLEKDNDAFQGEAIVKRAQLRMKKEEVRNLKTVKERKKQIVEDLASQISFIEKNRRDLDLKFQQLQKDLKDKEKEIEQLKSETLIAETFLEKELKLEEYTAKINRLKSQTEYFQTKAVASRAKYYSLLSPEERKLEEQKEAEIDRKNDQELEKQRNVAVEGGSTE